MDGDLYVGDRLLSSLRVVDLKDELMIRGLTKSGTKSDLVDRLRSAILKEQLQVPPPAAIPPVSSSSVSNIANPPAVGEYLPSHDKLVSPIDVGVPLPHPPALSDNPIQNDEPNVTLPTDITNVPTQKEQAIMKCDSELPSNESDTGNREVIKMREEECDNEAKIKETAPGAKNSNFAVSRNLLTDCDTNVEIPVIEKAPTKIGLQIDEASAKDDSLTVKKSEFEKCTPSDAETQKDNASNVDVQKSAALNSANMQKDTTRRSRSRSKSQASDRSQSSESSSSERSGSSSSSSDSSSEADDKSQEKRSPSPVRNSENKEDSNKLNDLPQSPCAENDTKIVNSKHSHGNENIDTSKNELDINKETTVSESGAKSKMDTSNLGEQSNIDKSEKKVAQDITSVEGNKAVEHSNDNSLPKLPKPVKMPRRIHLGSKPKSNDASGLSENTNDNVRRSSWGSRHKTSKQTSITISSDILKDLVPKRPTSPEITTAVNEKSEKNSDSQEENAKTETAVEDSKETDASIEEENKENENKELKRMRKIVIVQEHSEDKDTEIGQKQSDTDSPPIKKLRDREIPKDIPPEKVAVTRKVPVTVIDEPVRTRSPSPARHPESNIIHVRGLVRPFTLKQLKDLLSKTGTLVEEEFWIDNIKSHCIATYGTIEEAVATRKALHSVTWPSCNTKVIKVDFTTTDELNRHKGVAVPKKPEKKELKPARKEDKRRVVESQESKPRRSHSRDKIKPSEEKRRDSSLRHKDSSPSRDRPRRSDPPVREWDKGKVRDTSPPIPRRSSDMGGRERINHRRSRSPQRPRDDRRGDERQRERTPSKRRREREDHPTLDAKKEAPAKLLDELFRKTNATPCIYWLPLTEEQSIARKAEIERVEREEREEIMARDAEMEMLRAQRRRSMERSGGGRYRDLCTNENVHSHSGSQRQYSRSYFNLFVLTSLSSLSNKQSSY